MGVELDASKRSAQAQALAVETSFKRHGINRWGCAFIRASNEGHLVFAAPNSPAVDLLRAVARAGSSRHLHALRGALPDDDREPDGHAEGRLRQGDRRQQLPGQSHRRVLAQGQPAPQRGRHGGQGPREVQLRPRGRLEAEPLLLAMAQPPLKGSAAGLQRLQGPRVHAHGVPRGRARAPRDHRARVDPRGPALPRRPSGAGLDREARGRHARQAVQPRQRPLAELWRREQQVRPRRPTSCWRWCAS